MDDFFEIKLMVGGCYYPLRIKGKTSSYIVKPPVVSTINSTGT